MLNITNLAIQEKCGNYENSILAGEGEVRGGGLTVNL